MLMIGCTPETRIPHDIRSFLKNMDNEITARELLQMYTNPEVYEEMHGPEMCNEVVDEKPNGYTDESTLNPKGHRWAIGGI